MGGDFAPRTVVLGAISASRKLAQDSRIVLFGDKSRIEEILAEENCPDGTFDIVHTSEVIEMGDNPTQLSRKKPTQASWSVLTTCSKARSTALQAPEAPAQ